MPIPTIKNILADNPEWWLWPFGPGYGQSWLPNLARLAFAAAILGVIFLFLRLLFGPNGRFRDKDLDREAEEQRARELEDLERRREAGEVSEAEYTWEKRRIER